jgi:glycosyltransferase involved in cell wall biosynthesis
MSYSKKKLAIVGSNGLPGRYGGWDQLLEHLVEGLTCDYDITVYASKLHYDVHPGTYKGAKIVYLPLKATGFQSVPYDILSMIHAFTRKADMLLVLGTSGCIAFPIFRLMGLKLILNPDGAEWKRGKWSLWVKMFLRLSERLGVKWATHVVSDSAIIEESLRIDYGVSSTMIAYGGDHVNRVQLSEKSAQKFNISAGDYCFKVCRIEPENNLSMILESFSKSGFRLLVVGNWNYSQYGVNLRRKYSEFSNISMVDPIYDQNALNELRSNCRLYIHGHSVGGTNPSLVEAMCLGLCVLAFSVNYNKSTTSDAALYFSSSEELTALVTSVYNDDVLQREVGERLFQLGHEKYSWSNIIKKYKKIFSML